jgi:hypothetical protein
MGGTFDWERDQELRQRFGFASPRWGPPGGSPPGELPYPPPRQAPPPPAFDWERGGEITDVSVDWSSVPASAHAEAPPAAPPEIPAPNRAVDVKVRDPPRAVEPPRTCPQRPMS